MSFSPLGCFGKTKEDPNKGNQKAEKKGDHTSWTIHSTFLAMYPGYPGYRFIACRRRRVKITNQVLLVEFSTAFS
jgi:hypothetical protein